MRNSRFGTVAVATLLVVLAACGSDDGATVRDLGADGSASASGSASGSSSGSASGPAPSASGPSEADGGYDYASDVSSHRLLVADICEVNELLDADPIDFEAVGDLYRNGKNSVKADGSVRALARVISETQTQEIAEMQGVERTGLSRDRMLAVLLCIVLIACVMGSI